MAAAAAAAAAADTAAVAAATAAAAARRAAMIALGSVSKDELDGLVSDAIQDAEQLEDAGQHAEEAWSKVMLYEIQLAEVTTANSVPGGVARVGAVRAAIAAGRRDEAARLAKMLSEGLSEERRAAMAKALESIKALA